MTGRSSKASAGRSSRAMWSAEEVAILKQCVEEQGATRSWSAIAERLPGRTAKQCRFKWLNQSTEHTKSARWEHIEELIIASEHVSRGPSWARTSRLLTGRTENSVKNHWNGILRSKTLYRPCSILWHYIKHLAKGTTPCKAIKAALAAWRDFVPSSLFQTVQQQFHDWQRSGEVAMAGLGPADMPPVDIGPNDMPPAPALATVSQVASPVKTPATQVGMDRVDPAQLPASFPMSKVPYLAPAQQREPQPAPVDLGFRLVSPINPGGRQMISMTEPAYKRVVDVPPSDDIRAAPVVDLAQPFQLAMPALGASAVLEHASTMSSHSTFYQSTPTGNNWASQASPVYPGAGGCQDLIPEGQLLTSNNRVYRVVQNLTANTQVMGRQATRPAAPPAAESMMMYVPQAMAVPSEAPETLAALPGPFEVSRRFTSVAAPSSYYVAANEHLVMMPDAVSARSSAVAPLTAQAQPASSYTHTAPPGVIRVIEVGPAHEPDTTYRLPTLLPRW